MPYAKQITHAYDMRHDGSVGLWPSQQDLRDARTQFSIMRKRMKAAAIANANAQPKIMKPDHEKTYDASRLTFHASPLFKSEEVIERVVNILLVLTILFVVAWLSLSIVTHDDFAFRRPVVDMSQLEPVIDAQKMPPVAANQLLSGEFLPDIGKPINLNQVSGGQVMRLPPPPPSLEDIEAIEADDGMIAGHGASAWGQGGALHQFDI